MEGICVQCSFTSGRAGVEGRCPTVYLACLCLGGCALEDEWDSYGNVFPFPSNVNQALEQPKHTSLGALPGWPCLGCRCVHGRGSCPGHCTACPAGLRVQLPLSSQGAGKAQLGLSIFWGRPEDTARFGGSQVCRQQEGCLQYLSRQICLKGEQCCDFQATFPFRHIQLLPFPPS